MEKNELSEEISDALDIITESLDKWNMNRAVNEKKLHAVYDNIVRGTTLTDSILITIGENKTDSIEYMFLKDILMMLDGGVMPNMLTYRSILYTEDSYYREKKLREKPTIKSERNIREEWIYIRSRLSVSDIIPLLSMVSKILHRPYD